MAAQPKYINRLFEEMAVIKSRLDTAVQASDRAHEQHERMDSKLDELNVRMVHVELMSPRLVAVEKTADDYKNMKQRGAGLWLVALMFGSTFGGWLLKKIGVST